MKYIVLLLLCSMIVGCGYIQSTERQNQMGTDEKKDTNTAPDSPDTDIPQDDIVPAELDVEKEDSDAPVEQNQFPNIEGVWKMDVESYVKTAGDCHALIDSGSTFRPYRKFVKTDPNHIEIFQCDAEDTVCDTPLYSLGVYNYSTDEISGTGEFVDNSIGTYVKSEVLENQGTFTSEKSVHFVNRFKVSFWTDEALTTPAANFQACDHEITYDMNKI